MVTRSPTLRVVALSRIAASDDLLVSTKSTETAPRDSASNPRAPDPANRSSTRASGIDCCRILNHASFTRSPVGRTVRPAGALRRRPLNSPAMMRSKTRDPRLNRGPTLPVVPLQPECHVEWIRQPVLRYFIGPTEPDRRQQAGAIVQREPQVIRPDAPGADRARVAYAEHRRRIARPARLEVPNQAFQIAVHLGERQLEVHPLARRQVGGGEKLARHAEERNAKGIELVAPDGQARRHHVAAVFLEVRADFVQRAVQVEARNAAPRTAAELSRGVPPDEECRPAVALHESRCDDADDAGMPRLIAEHDRGVARIQCLVDQLDRLVENQL